MASNEPTPRSLRPSLNPVIEGDEKPAAVPSSSVEEDNNEGNDGKLATTSNDNNNKKKVPTMDSSQASRSELRKELQARSYMLTVRETMFLEELLERGDEFEVQLAHKNLLDAELFFAPQPSSASNDMETIGRGIATGNSSAAVAIDGSIKRASMDRSVSDASVNTQGSERRQYLLKSRKDESLFLGNMWKAHESGLGLTKNASRRSVLARQNSFSGQLLNSSSNRRSLARFNIMHDLESDNMSQYSAAGRGRREIFRKNMSLADDLSESNDTSASRRQIIRRQTRSNSSGSLRGDARMSRCTSAGVLLGRPVLARRSTLAPSPQIPRPRQMRRHSSLNDATRDSVASTRSSQQGELFRSGGRSKTERQQIFKDSSKGVRMSSITIPDGLSSETERPQIYKDSKGIRMSSITIPDGLSSEIFSNENEGKASIPAADTLNGSDGGVAEEAFAKIPEKDAGDKPLAPLRSSLKLPPPRPAQDQLRRLTSDASRKSVTFQTMQPLSPFSDKSRGGNDDDDDDEDDKKPAAIPLGSPGSIPSSIGGGPPSIHMANSVHSSPRRAPSIHMANSVHSTQTGIPSIHLAHSVHSSTPGRGPPSIHMANSVHSTPTAGPPPSIRVARHQDVVNQSFRSLASEFTEFTRESGEGRDPSECYREEKKQHDDFDKHSPIPRKVEIHSETLEQIPPTFGQAKQMILRHDNDAQRPVLMRDASCDHVRDEEGIEVADLDCTNNSYLSWRNDPMNSTRQMNSLAFVGDGEDIIRVSNSFDETMSFGRLSNIFRRSIPRSLSDDNIQRGVLGSSKVALYGSDNLREMPPEVDDDVSWMDDWDNLDYYDAWKVVEDEYENGYGGGGTLPFLILGTSADDVSAHPHVLSPPLMESLQAFFPFSKSGDNFFMKYSLVRDGASLDTFLKHARGAKYTILAIETIDGEVFGSFTGESWRKSWNYFGNGESFLWRMRRSRKEKCRSIIDQAHMESEVDVFPFTGDNDSVQLCTHNNLAVGGGSPDECSEFDHMSQDGVKYTDKAWGFGLAIASDMLNGTSSPCVTFRSPPLSAEHADGSPFEIINLELWTLTPCMTQEEAEKLDLAKLFLARESKVM